MNAYVSQQEESPSGTAVLVGMWTVWGSLLAFAVGTLIVQATQYEQSKFLSSVSDDLYFYIATFSFLPFLLCFYIPESRTGFVLAPLLALTSSWTIGLLTGHIVKLGGWDNWSLIAACILASVAAVLWVRTIGLPYADQDPVPNSEPTAIDAPSVADHAQPLQQSQPVQQLLTSYEFGWKVPTKGLDALAGMAALKADIEKAIAGFRAYVQGGPVVDRNGILLYGPPGNGKTATALAIAGELRLPYVRLSVQDLTSKYINESPAILRDLFRQAARQPCVVFMDEFDAVASTRGSQNASMEDRKVVTALLSEIDQARSQRIVLIAATNFLDDIDSAIMRDGRFDFRIEIPYPDEEARVAILTGLTEKFKVRVAPSTINKVAELWERRSVAFMDSAVKHVRDEGKGRWREAKVDDFKAASRAVSRRAGSIPAKGPKILELVLPARVREEVESLLFRLRRWETVAARGGETPSGVLLYGPPGTGKTNFVRALARELGDWHVFEVNAAEVIAMPSKFRETVELAANHRPAIVFIDEADELLRERNHSYAASATNEVLKTMDGMMGTVPEVVFFAATNNMEVIDSAALRGGRFSQKIYMPPLSGDDLLKFLDKELKDRVNKGLSLALSAEELAQEFGEIAPSDAISIIRNATNYTFSDKGDIPLRMDHIRRARESLER